MNTIKIANERTNKHLKKKITKANEKMVQKNVYNNTASDLSEIIYNDEDQDNIFSPFMNSRNATERKIILQLVDNTAKQTKTAEIQLQSYPYPPQDASD